MYADRVEAEASRSMKERLDGTTTVDSSRRRTVTGKRQRQDDKWEHDLFDDEPQLSKRKVGARDLRLKLQKKGLQSASQSGKAVSGVRDLREKLSGIVSAPKANTEVQRTKQGSEAPKQARRSAVHEASVPAAAKSAANPVQRKKNQKDAMESFLDSLGLEKYSITFQAEEVDMTALKHMTDEDLKAMGIPMGPRKKIILALESRD